MKELVAVTIPIYKQNISEEELASLTRCLNILGKYKIIFFAPASLDTAFYENFCHSKIDFAVERFADNYFIDIPGYNRLMLSTAFYKRFNNYKYILIYQLDAYVFKDELEYWCKQGYDYIGAPYIFVNLDTYPIKVLTKYRKLLRFLNKYRIVNYTYRHVGNGGFSLRNVNKCIMFLNIFHNLANKWSLNEDSLFTHYGNLIFPLFRLAPEDEALRFAFEAHPDKAYQTNQNQLPFGCHAFYNKNNKVFWKKFIII
jgi:hypothetical protein